MNKTFNVLGVGASFSLAVLAGCSGEAADEAQALDAAAAGSVSASSGGASQSGSTSAVGQGGAASAGSSTTSGGAASAAGAGSSTTSTGGAAQGGNASAGSAGATGGNASAGSVGAAGGNTSAGSAGAAGGNTSAGSAGAAGGNASAGSAGAAGAPGAGPVVAQACTGEALLRRYAPTDKEALKLFDAYLKAEVATLRCDTGGNGGSRTITNTIFVAAGATYDGKGEKIKADAGPMKCDTSEGEQGESQRPYFLLAPGATLKNVTIEYPGCDGIHLMGDNTLENVTWSDVGEDAASSRSYFPGGKILIKSSKVSSARDKVFQFNVKSDVRIENFTGTGIGKLVRQNGGATFELRIDLNNVKVTGVTSAVVQSDSPACFIRHHALSYTFTGSGDESDRVFRDVPPANVTQY